MGRGLMVLVVLGAGCSADQLATTFVPIAGSPWDECVSFGVRDLAFTAAPIAASQSLSVNLRNPTTSPIAVSIEGLRAPFELSQVGRVDVPPGGTDVTVSFSPTDQRRYEASLALTQDPRCGDTRLPIVGQAPPSLQTQSVLVFGQLPVGVEASEPLTVVNGHPTAVTVTVGATLPFVVTSQFTLEAHQIAQLFVSVTPTQPGPLDGALSLSSNLGDLRQVTLRARAGAPALEPSPQRVTIDRLPLPVFPARATRTLQLLNHGDDELIVDQVEFLAADANSSADELAFNFSPPLIAPVNGAAPLSFELRPRTLGPHAWLVRVHSNDPVHPVVDVSVTATVEAIAPCLEPVSAAVGGPLIVVGPYPQQAVLQLQNPNGVACLLDEVQFVGDAGVVVQPQLLLPATAPFELPVEVRGPGRGVLLFTTFGFIGGPLSASFIALP